MPTLDDMLQNLKEQADHYFSLANNERETARQYAEDRNPRGQNEHLLLAMRYTSKAEDLLHEYHRLGGV